MATDDGQLKLEDDETAPVRIENRPSLFPPSAMVVAA
jgi:hypothetical protein